MSDTVLRELRAAHEKRAGLPAPDSGLVARVKKTLKASPGAKLHFSDLLLAEGCAKGDGVALAEFEENVLPKVRDAVAKIDRAEAFIDETLQAVRHRLLSRLEGAEPRIRQYSGEGPLATWTRVAATRIALNLKRAQGPARDEASQEELEREPLQAASPELAVMRAHLAEKMVVALKDALAMLTAKDRNLLRLHLVDGLPLEQLGAMMGAHKSTLSRRIAKLEAELVEQTREALQRRFGIRARELASAMKVFSQKVAVSVRGVLGPAEPD